MSALLRPERAIPAGSKSAGAPVRVMIVDDSLTVRTVFTRMIERESDMIITATASTAERALAELKKTAVDVILLDLEMPGMGGLEALPKILETAGETQVLVVSSLTDAGAEHTVRALQMGAADTMLKPRPGGFNDEYRTTLLTKIRALKGEELRPGRNATLEAPPARQPGKLPQALAIGASTGGIHALNLFLRQLPPSFDLPIFITQHLPESFMPVFAKQMELAAKRQALLAEEGLEVRRGHIYIAPGYSHMLVRRVGLRRFCGLAYHPVKSGCMPSVDPMFESLAEAYEGKVAGVVLSGMGRDGADGAQSIVNAGGTILAQDAESCAVWGMPRAVTENGTAAAVLPPEQLAHKIVAMSGAEAWQ